MWDNWEKYLDENDAKRYELMIGTKVQVLIGAYLTKVNSSWKVEIVAFSPGAGEYIDYEGTFDDFESANQVAWEQATIALEWRRQRLAKL